MAFVLIFLAFAADLVGMIPFVQNFTATIFWLCAGIYFYLKGMGILNGKKLAAIAISWVASMIPILQSLPIEVTAGIIAVIFITRVEDKTGVSVLKPMSQGKAVPGLHTLNLNGRREPPQKTPLNQSETRQPQLQVYEEPGQNELEEVPNDEEYAEAA
jgi:hypothetical protein